MVKNLKYIVLVFIIGSSYCGYSQVSFKIDESINQQLRMKNARIDSTKVSGYRIQIAFNSDKNKARTAQSKFRMNFPQYSQRTYMIYQQPYYKVRVGDFYREIDSQKLLQEIRVRFPNAFVVKDYVKRPIIEE